MCQSRGSALTFEGLLQASELHRDAEREINDPCTEVCSWNCVWNGAGWILDGILGPLCSHFTEYLSELTEEDPGESLKNETCEYKFRTCAVSPVS